MKSKKFDEPMRQAHGDAMLLPPASRPRSGPAWLGGSGPGFGFWNPAQAGTGVAAVAGTNVARFKCLITHRPRERITAVFSPKEALEQISSVEPVLRSSGGTERSFCPRLPLRTS